MIDVTNLSKSYGPVQAVRDVSFHVGRGEIVGFLGPNGAGKSTTLRIVAGFLGATAGRVTIDGIDTNDEPMRARAAIGYMPEAVPLYGEMRVAEYLRFRADLKRVSGRERNASVARAMRLARVEDRAETLIGNLSKGYRQRVGLADALVAKPPILILDEPTAGLDPNQIREVRALVKELGREHTVLLSTHILSEVEAACDRAIVIAKGRVVAEGTLEALRRSQRSTRARLVVRVPQADVRAADVLALVAGVTETTEARLEGAPDVVTLTITWSPSVDDAAAALERVVAALVGDGFGVREAAPERTALEDVFARLTGEVALGAASAAPAGGT